MLNWIVWNTTDFLYKMDLALHNLQRLIGHKTLTNKQTNIISHVQQYNYVQANIHN